MEWMAIMEIEKKDLTYAIESKIKYLNGRKNMISEGEELEDTLEDIEAQIEALTNALKMI
jgi:hypothetical protein